MSRTEKRKTSQKQAISDALIRMDCHPTATMIADELQEKGQKASRATVFRRKKARSGKFNYAGRMCDTTATRNRTITCIAFAAAKLKIIHFLIWSSLII